MFIQDFIYPEGVALPVGGADNHPIVLLEVHYDNPMRRNGMQWIDYMYKPVELCYTFVS